MNPLAKRPAILPALLLLLAGLALPALLTPAAAAETPPDKRRPTHTAAPTTGIQGLWVWREQWVRTAEQRAALIAFCRTHGYNRLLVQIHRIKTDGPPQLEYPDQLADLIARAAAHGIAVEALDGGPTLGLAHKHERTLANLEAVLAFNRTLPEGKRLVGIHLDIEPYLLDEWDADDATRQAIMRQMLTLYDKIRQRVDQEPGDLLFAADIPFWYDNKTEPGDNCLVEHNGQTKNLHKHIQDVCDYVGIMSYRRKAVGRNAVLELVQEELAYAKQIGSTITPALETTRIADVPQITFYGTSPVQFWRVHEQVRAGLADHPAFGGILTHSYHGMRELYHSADTR